jgi:hypothetical protein
MDGAAMAPAKTTSRQIYLILTIVLGIAGSLGALAAFGERNYVVGPLVVRMKVTPATEGTTALGVEFAQLGLKAGGVKTKTHSGFLALEGDVVGIVGAGSAARAVLVTKDPASLAKTIRDEGKTAMRNFGIRLGWLTLAGGAAGGGLIALVGLKTRRLFQGALAGALVVAVLGILAWQTYDINNFDNLQFVKPSAGVLQR